MIDLPKNKKLILFDGTCNLCNSSVKYIIKHDKKNIFIFTALQNNTGKQIIEYFKIDTNKIDSILLMSSKNTIESKSTAVLKIAYHLGFPQNITCVFIIIPRSIRDAIYQYISKNRYKWFGKNNTCLIPSPLLKNKFLE